MKSIELDEWKLKSVKERQEILKAREAPPSLFQMVIMVILKKLEGRKPPRYLLDTTVFKHHDVFRRR